MEQGKHLVKCRRGKSQSLYKLCPSKVFVCTHTCMRGVCEVLAVNLRCQAYQVSTILLSHSPRFLLYGFLSHLHPLPCVCVCLYICGICTHTCSYKFLWSSEINIRYLLCFLPLKMILLLHGTQVELMGQLWSGIFSFTFPFQGSNSDSNACTARTLIHRPAILSL